MHGSIASRIYTKYMVRRLRRAWSRVTPLRERSSYGGREQSEILLAELNQAKPMATLELRVWGPQRGY